MIKMASSSPATSLMETQISKHVKYERSTAKTPLLPVSRNPYSKSNLPVKPNNTNISKSPSFAKFTLAIFLFMLTLAIFVFIPLVRKELAIGPQPPAVKLTALSIHKFNVSDKNLMAEWDVKLKMSNPNLVSSVWFDRLEGFVLYEDRPLAIEAVEPFGLQMKTTKEVRLRLKTAMWEGVQPALKEGVLNRMGKDRDSGSVKFSIQMAVWGTFTSGLWWSAQHVIINPHCLDLQVAFVPGATTIGFGILIGKVPRSCYVPMLAE